MKRFIKNILIFAVIISIITALISFIYVKRHGLDPYGPEKFAAIPNTIQICNFGTSHGMLAFNYEDFEDEYACFNFGLSSQSLSYDYRLFQYYGDRIVEGAVVFIPVSYPSLFGIEESSKSGFWSKNNRYYTILPPSLIKEYNLMSDIYVRLFPALMTNTGNLIKTLLGIKIKDTTWQGTAANIDIAADALRGFDEHVGDRATYYDDDGNRIENQEEIGALYALVRGCQEKGAIPVLITTPFLREYTATIKENAPDFYDHFYSVIDRVVRDTGVEYYDYAFDERFANEYSWLRDTTHLNKEGARNFTNIVMEEIVYANGYLDK